VPDDKLAVRGVEARSLADRDGNGFGRIGHGPVSRSRAATPVALLDESQRPIGRGAGDVPGS
jgi:hypothetical protein